MQILKWIDPADYKGGLWRLTALSLVTMTALRWIINPDPVTFHPEDIGVTDYWAMIAMSACLIAFDAMILVVVSWTHFRDWKDALGVATMVGTTHVVFPLFTFFLTAGTAFLISTLGLPAVLAGGVQTAIFFMAFWFVFSHLMTVHEQVRETDPDLLIPNAPVATWVGLKQMFPGVLGVSIDALMVGPAKVAFMDRYTPAQFWLSFVLIGAGVFALVFLSGVLVLILKRQVERRAKTRVHYFNLIGSLGLVGVFIHFSIFAAVYVLYTLVPIEWILHPGPIWFSTGAIFITYLALGRVREILVASRVRAGMA